MPGKRIIDPALVKTNFTDAVKNDALALIDWEGLVWARPLPIKLLGNAWWQGSYDNIIYSNDVKDDHNYVRLSTDGGETWVVFNVAICSGALGTHSPVSIGVPSNGLSISGDSSQILSLNTATETTPGALSASDKVRIDAIKWYDVTNTGTGLGLFKDISTLNDTITFNFKNIKAGTGVTLTPDDNDIIIDATGEGGGEVNTASNIGTTGIGFFDTKSGVDLQFKNLALDDTETVLQLTEDVNKNIRLGLTQSNIDHNVLTNYISNEHIDHSSVLVSSEEGISGGGNLTSNINFKLDFNTLLPLTNIAENDLIAFYRNDNGNSEHHTIKYSNVRTSLIDYTNTLYTPINTSIKAGLGLSGGGKLSQDRTLYLNINGLPIIPYSDTDYIAVYDSSSLTHGKLLLDDLLNATIPTINTNSVSGLEVNGGDSATSLDIHLKQNDSKLPIVSPVINDYIGFYDSSTNQQARAIISEFPGWNVFIEGQEQDKIKPGEIINFTAGEDLEWTYNPTVNELQINYIGSGGSGGIAEVFTQFSVQGNGTEANKIQLVGDSANPGNVKYYGTNQAGVKGYYDLTLNTPRTWIGLDDTVPENYINKSTYVPMVNSTEDGLDLVPTEELETITATFLLLDDTPVSYTGFNNHVVTVNSVGDGLIFADFSAACFKNEPNTFTEPITISSNTSTQLKLGENVNNYNPTLEFYEGTNKRAEILYNKDINTLVLSNIETNNQLIITNTLAYVKDNNIYQIWNASNDGEASGLNADLLDGFHASAFPQKNKDELITSIWSFNEVRVNVLRGYHHATIEATLPFTNTTNEICYINLGPTFKGSLDLCLASGIGFIETGLLKVSLGGFFYNGSFKNGPYDTVKVSTGLLTSRVAIGSLEADSNNVRIPIYNLLGQGINIKVLLEIHQGVASTLDSILNNLSVTTAVVSNSVARNYVNINDRLGINTKSPTEVLDVRGVTRISNTEPIQIKIGQNNVGSNYIDFYDGTQPTIRTGWINTGTEVFGTFQNQLGSGTPELRLYEGIDGLKYRLSGNNHTIYHDGNTEFLPKKDVDETITGDWSFNNIKTNTLSMPNSFEWSDAFEFSADPGREVAYINLYDFYTRMTTLVVNLQVGDYGAPAVGAAITKVFTLSGTNSSLETSYSDTIFVGGRFPDWASIGEIELAPDGVTKRLPIYQLDDDRRLSINVQIKGISVSSTTSSDILNFINISSPVVVPNSATRNYVNISDRLGIGTKDPTEALDVAGNIKANTVSVDGIGNPYYKLVSSSHNDTPWYIQAYVNSNRLAIGSTVNNSIFIEPNGNLITPHKVTIENDALTVSRDFYPVISSTRLTTVTGGSFSSTTGIASANQIMIKTSGDMTDGFGGGLLFSLSDNTYEDSPGGQARIYARRDGSDGKAAIQIWTSTSDLAMSIRSSGRIGIGTDSRASNPRAPLHIYNKGNDTNLPGLSFVGQIIQRSEAVSDYYSTGLALLAYENKGIVYSGGGNGGGVRYYDGGTLKNLINYSKTGDITIPNGSLTVSNNSSVQLELGKNITGYDPTLKIYEGSTERANIAFGTGTNRVFIRNKERSSEIRLGSGNSGLKYYYSGLEHTVYHTGNLDISSIGGGLQSVTENDKTGYRRADEDPANHGNIGEKAIDLVHSTSPSPAFGASGTSSIATGVNTIASGASSTATGAYTEASGTNSLTAGSYTSAPYNDLAVVGIFNLPESTHLFEVGNGGSNVTRSNAFSVGRNGTTILSKLITDPVSPETGSIYFNNSTKKFMGYNGTSWIILG